MATKVLVTKNTGRQWYVWECSNPACDVDHLHVTRKTALQCEAGR